MEIQKRENIGWVDLLRVLACFLVVLSHSCDPFIAVFEEDPTTFLTGVWTGSFVRACVPLFVMMTGVLLLPVTMDMKSFYRKRIGRIVVPLIFWSIVLPILYFVYLQYVPTRNPMIEADEHTLQATLTKLYTFIFNFNFDTIPMWYLYMLIGLYLIMPIISAWLKQATQKEVKLVLWIWGISLILPYVKMVAPMLGYTGNYGNMGLYGICDWNDYGTFYYLSGFIGYLILAYYLVKYPLSWSFRKTCMIGIPMFLAGYLFTCFGYMLTNKFFPGNYSYLEIIWYFAGINVFMMTFPVFTIIQKIKAPSSARLSKLAALTFGIYLSHFIIVQIAYDFIDTFLPLPTILQILFMAVSSFAISYVIVRLMAMWKVTKRFIA